MRARHHPADRSTRFPRFLRDPSALAFSAALTPSISTSIIMWFYVALGALFSIYALDLLCLVIVAMVARSKEAIRLYR